MLPLGSFTRTVVLTFFKKKCSLFSCETTSFDQQGGISMTRRLRERIQELTTTIATAVVRQFCQEQGVDVPDEESGSSDRRVFFDNGLMVFVGLQDTAELYEPPYERPRLVLSYCVIKRRRGKHFTYDEVATWDADKMRAIKASYGLTGFRVMSWKRLGPVIERWQDQMQPTTRRPGRRGQARTEVAA